MTSAGRDRWLALNFAITIFVSAFLLFQVQPLISKYILPWFGGSPAVWTTCMLFFQTLLFAGYAYAHISVKWLKPKQQAALHLVLIVAAIVAVVVLRVVPGDGWKPEGSANPVGRILAMLAATVGLPYFVLSSTGPLIQAWFARVFPGRIPYRLYALSNLGSLLALVSYPFWFERQYSAPQQAFFWGSGFVLYAMLCALAAISIWVIVRVERLESAVARAEASPKSIGDTPTNLVVAPRWWHRLLWLGLPAFASIVLLGTTNHISSDIPPMPFLWVVPLALYLVTFIIAFDHPRWYQPVVFAAIALVAVYLLSVIDPVDLELGTNGTVAKHVSDALQELGGDAGAKAKKPEPVELHVYWYIGISVVALFGICMMCHGELVRIRPHPNYLTAYFLMIAAGGAIGGLFVSMVAPQIFVTFFEFKMALFLGYLFAIALIVRSLCYAMGTKSKVAIFGSMLWIIPLLALPTLLIAGVGVHDLLHNLYRDEKTLYQSRNFFGTLRVVEVEDEGYNPPHYYYVLKNGNITHGLQFGDGRRRLATTYYGNSSGVGLTLGHFRRHADELGGMRVGAVGLGTGTVAVYLSEGDFIQFFEINPDVIKVATSDKLFTYLSECEGKYGVTLGDARLSMEREATPLRFHTLILDAFSSDAIPAHLLTEEAFEIYLRHLATPENGGAHGAIAVHVSNRYLDLEPVVRGLAEKFNLRQVQINNSDEGEKVYRSDWIILTRNEELVEDLQQFATKPDEKRKPAILWQDNRNNIFDVLK